MAGADICIDALKEWSQKAGNFRAFKLYEYMASGTPTVETIDPALPVDAWANDFLGLVPYENPDAMGKMIVAIRENPALWKARAARARQWVLENRSWEKVAGTMVDGFLRRER